jgi:3-dehydroquinate synthase
MDNHPYIHWQTELEQLFDPIEAELQNASAIYILTDENVHPLWMNTLLENCSILQRAHIIEIPAGESSKEWEIASQVIQQLLEDQADRQIWLINLGGGVITDLGGWIACNYKRGISFVNVPTTLMGMVDASIGGKNGINFMGNKNMIGTFQEPDALLIYPGFIETLPEQELLSGFAEMIKHALIADQALWEAITELEEIDASHLIPFIKRNIQIKNHFVFEDPFEENSRKLLNYGHTLGHALESWSLSQNANWSHGYCVAQGMKFANFLSWKKGVLEETTFGEVNEFLEEIYPSHALPSHHHITPYLMQDKKNNAAGLQFTLIEKPGIALFNQRVEWSEFETLYVLWYQSIN